MAQTEEGAFPRLTTAEIAVLKPLATDHHYADGETIFRAGQADIDLCVVESGLIDILNPTDGNRVIVTHKPGEFSGDIARWGRACRSTWRIGSAQPQTS